MPPQDKKYRVRFRASELETLHELPIREMDIGCMGGFRKEKDGSYALEAVVSERVLEKVKERRPVRVEIISDLDEEAERAKQIKDPQVGQGNRYTGKDRIPRGLGKKVRDEDRS
jgi:hypothetical protein